MDLKPFKLDIDELIDEFALGGFTELADLKRIWASRKFSFIFEASPSTNQSLFMQSLFAHSIGYMVAESSLPHRLGGLYCLFCLFETQPFKPPFKIYLSLGELKRLKNLVIDAKRHDVKVVAALVKSMLRRGVFLFGFVDMKDGTTGRVNELTDVQNAHVKIACKRLFADTKIEDFIHMDLGMELDVDMLKRKSLSYAAAKELAIREAGEMINVQNIKHITENKQLIGDVVEETAEHWKTEKELFYQQTGNSHLPYKELEANKQSKWQQCNGNYEEDNLIAEDGSESIKGQEDDNDNFCLELEEALLCLPYDYENEENIDANQYHDENFEG